MGAQMSKEAVVSASLNVITLFEVIYDYLVTRLTFVTPVGCEKITIHVQFNSDSPIMSYQQHNQNICCFISLSPALKVPNQLASENSIATHISSSTTDEILDILMFSYTITTEKKIRKRDQHIRYKLKQ